MTRRVATGFLAAALLAAIMTLVSSASVLALLTGRSVSAYQCAVSLYFDCTGNPRPAMFQAWLEIDGIQAFTYFIFGLFFTALDIFRRGFREGLQAQAEELGVMIGDTLLAQVSFFVSLVFRPIRRIVGFILVLVAVFCEVIAAIEFQTYLRALSAAHEVGQLFHFHPETYRYLLLGLVTASLPIVALAGAVAFNLWDLRVSFRRIIRYWLLGMCQIGIVALLPIALFSLCLSFFNLGLSLFVPWNVPLPFWPPGLTTVGALTLYLGCALVYRWRLARR